MPALCRRSPLAVVVPALLAAVPARAASPDDVLLAMEIAPADARNVSTEGTHATMFDTPSTLGGIENIEGADMAFLYTGSTSTLPGCTDVDQGELGPAGDTASITFDLDVPVGANSLAFDFFFLSREFPVFVGSQFNDAFTVTLTSQAYEGNIAFDDEGNPVNINNVLFQGYDPAIMAGTGFHCGDGGGTLWIETISPVVSGETIRIEFQVEDVYDGIYDSGVLIDRFRFSSDVVTEPSTGPADIDKDGEEDEAFGGPDCDDRDPTVNSYAAEACADGKDNNCDGDVDHDDNDCRTQDDFGGWADGDSPVMCACAAGVPGGPAAGSAGGLLVLAVARARRKRE